MKSRRSATLKDTTLAKALGADKIARIQASAHGPFGIMRLVAEVDSRLKPGKGKGRPTDESLTIRRLVGFKKGTWETLNAVSHEVSKQTRHSVSPAQIVSIIVEENLKPEITLSLSRLVSGKEARPAKRRNAPGINHAKRTG